MATNPPKLSIVTALFNSADYVDEFVERCAKAAEQITDNYEIILVNDCSPDDSLARAVKLHEDNPPPDYQDISPNDFKNVSDLEVVL